jgi:hypothetical protein
MNMTVTEGLKRLHQQYGNPHAVFLPAGQRLKSKQLIRVLLHDEGRVADAVAIGKRDRNGGHLVRYVTDRGRRFTLSLPRCQILVEW